MVMLQESIWSSETMSVKSYSEEKPKVFFFKKSKSFEESQAEVLAQYPSHLTGMMSRHRGAFQQTAQQLAM